jgi:hypothetical protein
VEPDEARRHVMQAMQATMVMSNEIDVLQQAYQ